MREESRTNSSAATWFLLLGHVLPGPFRTLGTPNEARSSQSDRQCALFLFFLIVVQAPVWLWRSLPFSASSGERSADSLRPSSSRGPHEVAPHGAAARAADAPDRCGEGPLRAAWRTASTGLVMAEVTRRASSWLCQEGVSLWWWELSSEEDVRLVPAARIRRRQWAAAAAAAARTQQLSSSDACAA